LTGSTGLTGFFAFPRPAGQAAERQKRLAGPVNPTKVLRISPGQETLLPISGHGIFRQRIDRNYLDE